MKKSRELAPRSADIDANPLALSLAVVVFITDCCCGPLPVALYTRELCVAGTNTPQGSSGKSVFAGILRRTFRCRE
jgi:hypothetical protein